MSKYTFKFKYKNETRYLELPIIATVLDKAKEEVIDFIEYEKELGKEIEKYVGYKGLEFSRTGVINSQIKVLEEIKGE